MTVADAARILEVKPTVVYDLCAAGLIAHQRIGLGRGVIRITPADLDAYVATTRVEARSRPPREAPSGTGLAVPDIIGQARAEKARRQDARAARRRGDDRCGA